MPALSIIDLGDDAIYRYRVDITSLISVYTILEMLCWIEQSNINHAHIPSTNTFFFNREIDVNWFVLRWS